MMGLHVHTRASKPWQMPEKHDAVLAAGILAAGILATGILGACLTPTCQTPDMRHARPTQPRMARDAPRLQMRAHNPRLCAVGSVI